MKKLIVLAAIGMCFSACSIPDSPSIGETAAAPEYFFPPTINLDYVYSHGSTGVTVDTTTYQTQLGGNYIKLVNQDPSSVSAQVLYYFKVEADAGKPVRCILSASGTGQDLVVLQGDLEIGSSWFADSLNTIEATVVGRYGDYLPPGVGKIFHDVVVVKFKDASKPEGNYIIRFFAKDYGLILEREVLNPTTEIANLQLIERISGPTKGIDRNNNHWYTLHGRYLMQQLEDDRN